MSHPHIIFSHTKSFSTTVNEEQGILDERNKRTRVKEREKKKEKKNDKTKQHRKEIAETLRCENIN